MEVQKNLVKRKEVSCYKTDQIPEPTIEQAAQRGCGFSATGDVPSPTGHSLGQPA